MDPLEAQIEPIPHVPDDQLNMIQEDLGGQDNVQQIEHEQVADQNIIQPLVA